MDRRTALASAAAILAVVVTGGAAIAANLGVLDDAPAQPAGALQPADGELRTIVVEPATSQLPAAADLSGVTDRSVGGSRAGEDDDFAEGGVDDDRDEGDEHDGDEDHEDSEGDEDHDRYEGADDDD